MLACLRAPTSLDPSAHGAAHGRGFAIVIRSGSPLLRVIRCLRNFPNLETSRGQLQFHEHGIEGALCVSDSEQKYTGDNFRGAEHASPYPVSRLGAPVSLVDMAKVIESASAKVALRTNAQLEVIVEQLKALQERAREIVEQASRDVDLIHAECRFHRVAGRVYHLYERPDGHRFFSMLGPDDYGGAGPTGFVASFRYEHDESWTRLDEIDSRDRRRAEIQGFVSNRLLGG